MKLPIRERCFPNPDGADVRKAKMLVHRTQSENPQLKPENDPYRRFLIAEPITDEPTLHLDDFSEIPVIGNSDNSRVLQQRARLRACDGDWVAQSRTIESGFSDYCEYFLGLGRVQWLYPAAPESDTRQLALECWQDRRLRHDLEHAIRRQDLRFVHPHVSTLNVWELATLLRDSTRMPFNVIGPTPALSNWANDKVEFSKTVARLLGDEFVPHTESAYNFASLAKKVARLAASNQKLCIKFPYGTGGHGNFLIDAQCVRGRSLRQIRNFLKERLRNTMWPRRGRVLIDVWEANVINSPSVQTWIPPLGCGAPIIEGVFIQEVSNEQGAFIGSYQSNLPDSLHQQIVEQVFLLATLFQELGYVGRCSYDLILTGNSIGDCQVEFIECNARWGGTSSPMTMMNRLELQAQQYSIARLDIPGLWQFEFAELARELSRVLYKPSTGQGEIVVFNPARIKEDSSIEVVALGRTVASANAAIYQSLSNHLHDLSRKYSQKSSLSGFLLEHADFKQVESNST